VAYLLLGMIAGGFVSIPVGPFGIWALSVLMNQGWRSAIVVAVGGACGDIVVLVCYLLLGRIVASFFEMNLEVTAQHIFENGVIRGFGLIAVGLFLIWSARREHKLTSKRTNFWISFFGAANYLNVPAIGFILVKLGIEKAAMTGDFWAVVIGFFIGAFVTWLAGMWLFSRLSFLREKVTIRIDGFRIGRFIVTGLKIEKTVLNLLLYASGIGCFFVSAWCFWQALMF